MNAMSAIMTPAKFAQTLRRARAPVSVLKPSGSPISSPSSSETPTRKQVVMGLDVGGRNIGVALSDDSFNIAFPFKIITQPVAASGILKTASALRDIIEKTDAIGIIVGWPLKLDGTEGVQCERTAQFVRRLLLRDSFSIPIAYWDERFSTQVAKEETQDLFGTHGRVDAYAAQNILQDFLDTMNDENSNMLVDEEDLENDKINAKIRLLEKELEEAQKSVKIATRKLSSANLSNIMADK